MPTQDLHNINAAYNMETRCVRSQRAFTLIELLIIVAIIGILATIAVPAYSDYIERIRVMQAIMDISSIEKRLTVYKLNADKLPNTLAEINQDSMLDPWGNPYHYINLTDAKMQKTARKDKNLVPINSDYDLYSSGKDGRSVGPLTASASLDDVVRANNGRFIGLAKNY